MTKLTHTAPDEPSINVNGHYLTDTEATAVRVALALLAEMPLTLRPAAGGRAMVRRYRKTARAVLVKMLP